MRQTFLLSALMLMMTTATMYAQAAYWITADDSLRNRPNTWMEFRKDITLKKKPKTAEARIAADSKYWLWVNGTLSYSFEDDGSAYRATITVPKGMTVRFLPLSGGQRGASEQILRRGTHDVAFGYK